MTTLEEEIGVIARRGEDVATIARAMCSAHVGNPDRCGCRGDFAKCRAPTIYNDLAVASIRALTKAGRLT